MKIKERYVDAAVVAGFLTLILTGLGGWTSLNSRVATVEATIEQNGKTTNHVRERVDKIYDHLLGQSDE